MSSYAKMIDLKSELEKKQAEAAKLKNSTRICGPTALNIKEKADPILPHNKKQRRGKEAKTTEIEDMKALEASREKLEAKAKLYDALKERGIDSSSGASELFLVDFDRKSEEEKKSAKLQLKGVGDLPSAAEVAESEAFRLEQQKQKWAKEEIEASLKDHVTYQDVFYDEARTHGAGYYAFSRDEAKRATQKASLDSLRADTEQKQRTVVEEKKRKEKELKERLKKVRQKKRLQMGLPLEEEEEEEEEIIGPSPAPEAAEPDALLSPLEKPVKDTKETVKQVRPWDIGKDGVTFNLPSVPKKVLSQEEWVDVRRQDRTNEFAPPVAYSQTRPKRPPPQPSNRGRGAYAAHQFFARQKFLPSVVKNPVTPDSSVPDYGPPSKVSRFPESGSCGARAEPDSPASDYCTSRLPESENACLNSDSPSDVERGLSGRGSHGDIATAQEKAHVISSVGLTAQGYKPEEEASVKRLTTADLFRNEILDGEEHRGDLSTARGEAVIAEDLTIPDRLEHGVEESSAACNITPGANEQKEISKDKPKFNLTPKFQYLKSGRHDPTASSSSGYGSRHMQQRGHQEKIGKNLKLFSSDITTNSETDMRAGDRGKSAIPPPSSMEYYSSMLTKKPAPVKKPKLEDSVAEGMMASQEKKAGDAKKKDKGMLALF